VDDEDAGGARRNGNPSNPGNLGNLRDRVNDVSEAHIKTGIRRGYKMYLLRMIFWLYVKKTTPNANKIDEYNLNIVHPDLVSEIQETYCLKPWDTKKAEKDYKEVVLAHLHLDLASAQYAVPPSEVARSGGRIVCGMASYAV
jgi:hypothetical protein